MIVIKIETKVGGTTEETQVDAYNEDTIDVQWVGDKELVLGISGLDSVDHDRYYSNVVKYTMERVPNA